MNFLIRYLNLWRIKIAKKRDVECKSFDLIECIYEQPEKWIQSKFRLCNEEAGKELWIHNGKNYCRPVGCEDYSLNDRKMAWSAYRWWCRRTQGSDSLSVLDLIVVLGLGLVGLVLVAWQMVFKKKLRPFANSEINTARHF